MAFRKIKGFTLVEIQIAILVLLLIMAVLMGSIQLAAKSTKATEKLASGNNDLRVISALLKQQITNILPLNVLDEGKTKLLFRGENDEIYYISHLPEHVVKGGPWLVHLYSDQQKLRLDYKVIDHAKTLRENLSADDYESVVLLDEIAELSIEYYHGENASWRSDWDDSKTMPTAVGFEIVQQQAEWPPIVVTIPSHGAVKTPFHILKIKK